MWSQRRAKIARNNPSIWETEKGNLLCKFKAILVYIVGSRPALTTEWTMSRESQGQEDRNKGRSEESWEGGE